MANHRIEPTICYFFSNFFGKVGSIKNSTFNCGWQTMNILMFFLKNTIQLVVVWVTFSIKKMFQFSNDFFMFRLVSDDDDCYQRFSVIKPNQNFQIWNKNQFQNCQLWITWVFVSLSTKTTRRELPAFSCQL